MFPALRDSEPLRAGSCAVAECPARQRLPGPPFVSLPRPSSSPRTTPRLRERSTVGSGGRRSRPGACAPPRSCGGGGGQSEGAAGTRPQASPAPAYEQRAAATARARTAAGGALWDEGAPPPAAALGSALALPAAETAPKEENLSVSACLPAACTSSPAAHPPALQVLLPPGLQAGLPAPAGRFPCSFSLEAFVGSSVPTGGSVPKAPCLALRGKGAGWGQARKGGSQWLS